METTGIVRSSFQKGTRNFVEIEILGNLPAPSEEVQKIKFYSTKKRSLDANAYHWQLVGQMAKALGTSASAVHRTLMLRYGAVMEDESGNPVVVAVKPMVDLDKLGVYARLIHTGDLSHYVLIKPSHEYNTSEMAALIDGTVDEAKEMGIETLTPRELEEIKNVRI